MKRPCSASRWLLFLTLVLAASLGACARQSPLDEKAFVGKWHSSRAKTPIRLEQNGEWELLNKDGEVTQYGVWQYFDNKLMWSVTIDEQTSHDLNPVVSASPKEFKLRERDGSVTTFSRLD